MRKRTLGVVLLAGLAMSGAGAFTASNTVPASTAGYGDAVVSGVTVTDIDYNLDAASDSVSSIDITTTTSIASRNLVLKLMSGATDVATATNELLATNPCVVTPVTGLGATCTFTTAVDLEDFDGLAITVYDND